MAAADLDYCAGMSGLGTVEKAPSEEGRFAVLDGWRAISILLVLAAHMLPLGPKFLRLNEMAGYLGMSLFFTLSGFLITRQLHKNHDIGAFFIRRLFRILPLAYAAVIVTALLNDVTFLQIILTLSFAQTFVEAGIMPDLGHFWSLCVELHFYVLIGLLMYVTRFRGFMVLPFAWALVVFVRFYDDRTGGRIHTHMRIDEILSGGLLAMLFLGKFGERARNTLQAVPVGLPLILWGLACYPDLWFFHPLRGFAASVLVGHTLLCREPQRYRFLGVWPLKYVAEISYALYVIHPLSMHGWLGQGATPAVKYAKRMICFAITFSLAHLSTFHFERRFVEWGKKLIKTRAPTVPDQA